MDRSPRTGSDPRPLSCGSGRTAGHGGSRRSRWKTRKSASEVLDWNQIFIDTLIATNTANSSSQRLGAIVHTAIFDAFNGIEQPLHADFRRPERPPQRVAPCGGHRCGVHRAGRLVPVATTGAGRQLCGIARRVDRRLRAQPLARTPPVRDRGSSAASPGEPRWRKRCSPGAPPMALARATRRSTAGPRSASGGRHRRRSAR